MGSVIFFTYLLAALSGLLVGSISPQLMITRSLTFGITMLHSVLAGAFIAVYADVVLGIPVPAPLVITTVALALSVLAAELIEHGFPEDTATALSVSVATTLTIVFGYLASVSSSVAVARAWGYVVGFAALATPSDVAKTFTALVLVIPLVHMTSRELKYIAFDEDGAKALGLNVRFYRYLFYALIAVTASVLASTIGVLIAHVVLAVPGAVAVRISKRNYHSLSYAIAEAVMICGYLLARYVNLPPSGGVGIASVLVIMSLLVARHGGG